MNAALPARAVGAVSSPAPAPEPFRRGSGAISQATPPRQGVPSGGRVALIPLSATRPIPREAR